LCRWRRANTPRLLRLSSGSRCGHDGELQLAEPTAVAGEDASGGCGIICIVRAGVSGDLREKVAIAKAPVRDWLEFGETLEAAFGGSTRD
jgi:hypothetical protein